MKTKSMIAITLSACIGLLTTSAIAAENPKPHGEHPESGHPHAKTEIPKTTEALWKEIHKHHQELAAAVKGKQMDHVHPHAVALRDLVNATPSLAQAAHKKHVETEAKKVTALVNDLHKSADVDDQKGAEASLKKLDAAIKTLEEHSNM